MLDGNIDSSVTVSFLQLMLQKGIFLNKFFSLMFISRGKFALTQDAPLIRGLRPNKCQVDPPVVSRLTQDAPLIRGLRPANAFFCRLFKRKANTGCPAH